MDFSDCLHRFVGLVESLRKAKNPVCDVLSMIRKWINVVNRPLFAPPGRNDGRVVPDFSSRNVDNILDFPSE
jgi:hypothetical protein